MSFSLIGNFYFFFRNGVPPYGKGKLIYGLGGSFESVVPSQDKGVDVGELE